MPDYEFTVVIERDEDAIRLHVENRLARNEPIYQEVGSPKVRVAV